MKDWRGTPIQTGDLAVWGSGVGRSIQLNEGIVEGFTKPKKSEYSSSIPEPRVKLRVTRRSYIQGVKPIVDVGADRLTIVTELPPCTLPTQQDKVDAAAENRRIQDAAFATHNFPPKVRVKRSEMRNQWGRPTTLREYTWEEDVQPPCVNCGVDYWTGYHSSCVPGHQS